MTSDAGALLLGATDRAVGLVDRFARCFGDPRSARLIEHEVGTLVGQRVLAWRWATRTSTITTELRHDPVMAVLAGKLAARRRTARRWPASRR